MSRPFGFPGFLLLLIDQLRAAWGYERRDGRNRLTLRFVEAQAT
jgi:hypothetical protein